ncbi:ACP S-malonyltransferase [Nocardia sp. CDC159]|uniref:Malonyl CoA-acyl carrier protein transacylase n=1 Tax=Nocardia pulmonis TaxID=2951408 RepID=A0A9X2E7Z5_9NOCA|nr:MULTISPECIES: ACP S-malonyltransferase [Nocardia]MCM6773173.1 ACP S-malonyltransferase [Nocardia pulmonis]MCM6785524.1 ACP S-malonyltransferase [Nocardia sp. CDC159]
MALIFPGQGTQQAGMGRIWRETPSWRLVSQLSELTGHDIAELLTDRSAEDLRRTDLAQLALFSICALALDALTSVIEPRPVAFAGHSLGEYSALCAAGALSLADGARLVQVRGRAMREAAEEQAGTMGVLVGQDLHAVQAVVDAVRTRGHGLWFANFNGPGQHVLSGTVEGVAAAAELAGAAGYKFIDIPVGGAFHSPMMAAAVPALDKALAAADFAPTHGPVVANVDAAVHTKGGVWPGLLARQLTHPVQWERTVRTLADDLSCRRLIEIGPKRTLAGMVRRIAPEVEVVSVGGPADIERLAGRGRAADHA